MTITRLGENRYSVVTDTVLSDGSKRSDFGMVLQGATLRSVEQKGHIRIGGLLRIELGPKSLARVQALAIGEASNV